MFKKCKDCGRTFPEYLVEDYSKIWKSPICPICAEKILIRMFGNADEIDPEVMNEALEFITNESKKNLGGFMINPPEECPYKCLQPDGGIWVDNGVCNSSCKDTCIRRLQWKRMTDDQRLTELFENGVINAQ